MKSSKFLLLFLLSFSLLTYAKKTPPNVVFFVVDDMGWTDLSSFGSDFYQSPNIDKLAKAGVRFTDAYAACTVCSPTRASLMTGKYPARINCTDWIEGWKMPHERLSVPDWTMYMAHSEYTLAEAFKDAGYATAHFGKWHLGEDSIYWPENHGFDNNTGGWKKGAPNRNKKLGSNGYFSPYGNPRISDGPEGEYLTERLANEACSFIEEQKEAPFFLNFWFYNVHTPLQAKAEKVDKYKALVDPNKNQRNPTYAAMVEHVDEAVGQVIDKLKKEGLYDNTIIVFTSDNGGLIGNKKSPKTNNYPLRSGKGDIYEGGVRVPTFILAPGAKANGQACDVPVISMDFYPTLMELTQCNNKKTTKQAMDGKSLAPLLNGASELQREAIYWHYPHYHIEGARPYSAIRKGDYKLIYTYEDDSYALYNLKDDISELKNLITDQEETFVELKADLSSWKQKVKAQDPSKNPNYNPEKSRFK